MRLWYRAGVHLLGIATPVPTVFKRAVVGAMTEQGGHIFFRKIAFNPVHEFMTTTVIGDGCGAIGPKFFVDPIEQSPCRIVKPVEPDSSVDVGERLHEAVDIFEVLLSEGIERHQACGTKGALTALLAVRCLKPDFSVPVDEFRVFPFVGPQADSQCGP